MPLNIPRKNKPGVPHGILLHNCNDMELQPRASEDERHPSEYYTDATKGTHISHSQTPLPTLPPLPPNPTAKHVAIKRCLMPWHYKLKILNCRQNALLCERGM